MFLVDGHTKHIGLIGSPVGHTLSPLIQNAMALITRENCVYTAFDAGKDDPAPSVMAMRTLGFSGFNVTIPHKQAVFSMLSETDDFARLAGSVNTVKFTSDGMSGYNTDGAGFLAALRLSGFDINGGTRVGILGAGGAARGVAAALIQAGVESVLVVNRSKQHADELIRAFKYGNIAVGTELELKNVDLLVNATSVGMDGDVSPLADISVLNGNTFVFDLIYNPRRTKLIRDAHEYGLKAENGLSMLVLQALYSFSIFCGKEIDESVATGLIKALQFPKNLVLTGFMGSGKTTVGTALSKKLLLPFYDTDTMIVKKHGIAIPEIFGTLGEEYFRKLETECIRGLKGVTGSVISLGGGAVLNPVNLDLLRSNSVIVNLNPTFSQLMKNLEKSYARPVQRPYEEIYKSRTEAYKNADLQVDTTGIPLSLVLSLLLCRYSEIVQNQQK